MSGALVGDDQTTCPHLTWNESSAADICPTIQGALKIGRIVPALVIGTIVSSAVASVMSIVLGIWLIHRSGY
jgi:hypothetical protein